MSDYSKQQAYPAQPEAQQQQGGGYPPQQSAGAYPPQHPPQQAGAYPPQHPPQQAGAYPPQQPAGAYPPQQAPPPYYPQQGPPPPQAQQQQQVTTTVIQAQPAIIAPVNFGPYPVTITDSQGRQVQTILEYHASGTTHLIACLICCIGCFLFWPVLFCFWIPYVLDGTKDVYHISPTDGSVVGVYRR